MFTNRIIIKNDMMRFKMWKLVQKMRQKKKKVSVVCSAFIRIDKSLLSNIRGTFRGISTKLMLQHVFRNGCVLEAVYLKKKKKI